MSCGLRPSWPALCQNSFSLQFPPDRSSHQCADRQVFSCAEFGEARDQVWLHRIRLERSIALGCGRHGEANTDITLSCQSTRYIFKPISVIRLHREHAKRFGEPSQNTD